MTTAAGTALQEPGRPAGPSRPAPLEILPRPPRPRRPPPRWIAPTIILAAAAAGVAIYWLALGTVDLRQVGDLGLIALLPPPAFAGLALLALAYTGTLALRREHPALLAVQLAALVAVLHGAVAAIEQVSRFQSAWIHAGFIDYIIRTGDTLPELDARFSWPGFFAFAALLAQAGGQDAVIGVLRWTPTLSNLAYLLPLMVIARRMATGWRARWLALWLFLAANWVGQDYFSPQGLAFLLYLVLLAAMVTWFRPPPRLGAQPATVPDLLSRAQAVAARRLERAARRRPLRWLAAHATGALPGLRRPDPTTPAERAGLLALLLVLFSAIIVSHQLTPFAVIAATAALVATDRLTLRGLPLLLVSMVAVWVSWMTVAYWSGNLADVIGSFGEVLSNFGANVGDRILGSEQRKLMQYSRIGFTTVILALAAVGLFRRLRAGVADWTVTMLAAAPFFIVALQSYGGEALFRAVFFALPFVALLAALAFFPSRSPRRSPAALLAVALVGVLLLPGFFLTRYGNEMFERFTPAEVAAMRYLYEHAPDNTSIVTISPWSVPGLAQDVGNLKLVPAVPDDAEEAELTLPELEEFVAANGAPGEPVVLMLSRVQSAYIAANHGRPESWVTDLERQVQASGDFRVEYANRDAQVLTLASTRDVFPEVEPEDPDGAAPAAAGEGAP